MNENMKSVECRGSSDTEASCASHSSFVIRHSSFLDAFSLIEIMVTVALLSFIILGLLAMFTQTQRAFRNSMKQVDVMSAGRAVTDMLARELKEITPSRMPFTTNFFAEIPPLSQPFAINQPFAENSLGGNPGGIDGPLRQGLPGTTYQGQPGTQERRTNIVQRFFFLSRNNQDWIGTGYEVLADSANAGVGTLYRFSTNRSKSGAIYLSDDFLNALPGSMSRIADGVVHFRLRAFATNGFPIIPNGSFAAPGGPIAFQAVPGGPLVSLNNTSGYWDSSVPYEGDYLFWSNAVPAYLELELGILEPHILERYKGIGSGNASAQRDYLSNHVAQVHLFRQRIPIRNVDFTAYQ